MDPTTVVLVPRRISDPWRERLWVYTRTHWTLELDLPVIEGHHLDGPFNRSAAINLAADLAGRWNVALVADADTIVDRRQAEDAAAHALQTGALTVAYTELVKLTRLGTEAILAGDRGSWLRHESNRLLGTVSSCIAVPRALFDRVGGFDERFRGWGYEDRAFYIAATTLGPPASRVPGKAYHLWHRRSAEKNPSDPNFQANRALADRYKLANHDAPAIHAILDERRP